MKNYTARLVTDNEKWSDLRGFVPEVALGEFDGGWNIKTFAHDLFEHWFEDSRYFKTRELSQSGECVAMGIRQYFYENSSIVCDFMGYNTYRGVEWNSWNTIVGQVRDAADKDGNDMFPNDFNYKHLSTWDGKNVFENNCRAYYKEGAKGFEEKIELAFSYGYWLGSHVFDNLDLVCNFLNKLKIFLDKTGISKTDCYDNYFEGFSTGFTMCKRSNMIIGKFDNGVTISTNKKIEPSIERWNKYYGIYA